ncbi:hypothetical protein HMPREF9538_02894 [Klebsiella sp. MS 92-3]|nr:hypothetical protein HMPREF9538_02894 [Klebsiella sp. MS 92-3]
MPENAGWRRKRLIRPTDSLLVGRISAASSGKGAYLSDKRVAVQALSAIRRTPQFC